MAGKLLCGDLSLANDTVLAIEEPVLETARLSHACMLSWTALRGDVRQIPCNLLVLLAAAHSGTHHTDGDRSVRVPSRLSLESLIGLYDSMT